MKKLSETVNDLAKDVAVPLLVAALIIPGGLVFVGLCIAAKRIYKNRKKT